MTSRTIAANNIMKFFIFILLILAGFIMVRWGKWISDNSGIRFVFAENFFGPGGTTTFWKILGVCSIVFAFVYLFNF